MKTLRLTESDYQTLCLMLGSATGAHLKENAPIPQSMKDLVDWVMIQGSPNNYTYWNDKNRLAEQKEAELSKES